MFLKMQSLHAFASRCVYNMMVDNPYRPHSDKNGPGVCLDEKPMCQDCRLQDKELIKSAHFTICQKPWTCSEHTNIKNKVLCEVLHNWWFELRDELEKAEGVNLSYRAPTTRYKSSMGMCKGFGDSKYIPIPLKLELPA